MTSSKQSDSRGSRAEAEVRYERRDARLPPLLLSAVALLALLSAVAAGTAGLFGLLAERSGRRPPSTSSSPALLADDRQLQELRRRERELLDGYGWVSREQGVVRVPVERAMELVLQENEGQRPPAPDAGAAPAEKGEQP